MADLNGGPLPIDLAPGGYTLQAPTLHGTAVELIPGDAATRGAGGLYEQPLTDAARSADVFPIKTFAIEVSSIDAGATGPASPGSTRSGTALTTPAGEPAMSLRVPSLGSDVAQAVLYTDESGVSRWVFPTGTAIGSPPTRGGGGDIEFLLPLHSPPPTPPADKGPGTRGELTQLGRRLVRVLAWATEDVIGKGAQYIATRWEAKRRPYGLRRFPGDTLQPLDWNSLRGGRVLLLIHGTFSTAQSAFDLLPPATLDGLNTLYGGRILAFDHPTVHTTPEENVQQFLDLLPPDIELELDVVTHSRGGLVGRELTERLAGYNTAARKLRIRRAIFVAAPLRGTVLTDTEHGIEMLDRYTNLFTELPDNTFTISMEAIFMMVKLVYHGAVKMLPGLRSMFPPGEYLERLNHSPTHTTEYYAIGSDFKPIAKTLLGKVGWGLADAAVDGIFGEANDGVVPTAGSYELQSTVSGFPINNDHRVIFERSAGIHHCNYFGAPRTSQCMLEWLAA